MSHPTIEQLAYAFELQAKLGMTVENRKFHASAQIGHVHYGYARHKDHESDLCAQLEAVNQCANSYYTKHPEEFASIHDSIAGKKS